MPRHAEVVKTSDMPMVSAMLYRDRLNLLLPKLTRANVRALMGYSWPGNIRELQNVIERAAILSRNGKLTLDLPKAVQSTRSPMRSGVSSESESDAAEMVERRLKNDQENVLICKHQIK